MKVRGDAFDPMTLLTAFIGAVVLLGIVNLVRRGKVRNGAVYMPPFEGTLTQEAIWTIRTYIETRREP